MSPTTPPPPSREQLQGSLRELHAQLERTPQLDARSRAALQSLLAEMHHLLHRGQQPGAGREPFAERLEAMTVAFEADHPLLAGALREFVELCSRAGI
jgi:hypothetical protein